MSGDARLLVIADGRKLPDDEARAVWTRFSAWMDEHPGDMDGFARREGWATARPETRDGKAVLVLSNEKAPAPPRAGSPRSKRGKRKGGSR
jgi:hypothetical protein